MKNGEEEEDLPEEVTEEEYEVEGSFLFILPPPPPPPMSGARMSTTDRNMMMSIMILGQWKKEERLLNFIIPQILLVFPISLLIILYCVSAILVRDGDLGDIGHQLRQPT